MKSKSAEKVKLKSFDDLFGTDTVAGAGETDICSPQPVTYIQRPSVPCAG